MTAFDSQPRGVSGTSEVADRRVTTAIAALAAGRVAVVTDDADRENEGDLIFAADAATTELLAFTVRYSSGVVCAPAAPEVLDSLALPQMTTQNAESMRTAYTVTVDAANGVTTGISAADRARTLRVLADPTAGSDDLVRPGHVFPLRARSAGVLERDGHTEAAVDLLGLAGRRPIGAIAELVRDDGSMMRGEELIAFCREHGLPLLSIAELVAYRRRHERLLHRVAEARLPTEVATFTAFGYRGVHDGVDHIALTLGRVSEPGTTLVRVHSECLTGEVFGSRRCDCGPQLSAALAEIAAADRGVVVYLRGHEGRGIGIGAKLSAYALQDAGHDTVDANRELGLPVDGREYSTATQILADLGVGEVELLTNNPAKPAGLRAYGTEVTVRRPLLVRAHNDNAAYLRAKRDRLGHLLPQLAESAGEDGATAGHDAAEAAADVEDHAAPSGASVRVSLEEARR